MNILDSLDVDIILKHIIEINDCKMVVLLINFVPIRLADALIHITFGHSTQIITMILRIDSVHSFTCVIAPVFLFPYIYPVNL